MSSGKLPDVFKQIQQPFHLHEFHVDDELQTKLDEEFHHAEMHAAKEIAVRVAPKYFILKL